MICLTVTSTSCIKKKSTIGMGMTLAIAAAIATGTEMIAPLRMMRPATMRIGGWW